jgi:hypothetical protein
MFSEDLLAYLVGLEGRPWVEWKNGKPLTKASLARLVNPFEVYPPIGATTRKGYHLRQFKDASTVTPLSNRNNETSLQPQ